jgi:hypothetical protein
LVAGDAGHTLVPVVMPGVQQTSPSSQETVEITQVPPQMCADVQLELQQSPLSTQWWPFGWHVHVAVVVLQTM